LHPLRGGLLFTQARFELLLLIAQISLRGGQAMLSLFLGLQFLLQERL
jgi:hypothetical protein